MLKMPLKSSYKAFFLMLKTARCILDDIAYNCNYVLFQ